MPKIELKTGVEVLPIINNADKKNTSEPINIQNSLELLDSSFIIAGIFLKLKKNNPRESNKKNIRKEKIKIFIALPASVKACTEVSPKIPVRVKNVEYKIKTKLKKANK